MGPIIVFDGMDRRNGIDGLNGINVESFRFARLHSQQSLVNHQPLAYFQFFIWQLDAFARHTGSPPEESIRQLPSAPTDTPYSYAICRHQSDGRQLRQGNLTMSKKQPPFYYQHPSLFRCTLLQDVCINLPGDRFS